MLEDEISTTTSKKAKVTYDYYDDDAPAWWAIPEDVLLNVFEYLNIADILHAGETCKRWNCIGNDNILWKKKFQKHYKTDAGITIKPGAQSWKQEYMRLTSNIPFVQSQRLSGHAHQVLHVSFSHNGEMFATCSKDGYVIVWSAAHPCREKYSHNMKQFSWKYTQYSQFNQSDTLLLVSGVHFGAPQSTSGEIAVFTVDGQDESHLRCRVSNRPYDIFGSWFSDQYLISGDLYWLAHLVSTSVLWLNKANQEIDSEHVPIMNQLHKFYNKNASSVRSIMMAKCPWLDQYNDPLANTRRSSKTDEKSDSGPAHSSASSSSSRASSVGNPLSHSASLHHDQTVQESSDDFLAEVARELSLRPPYDPIDGRDEPTIRYADEFRREYGGVGGGAVGGSYEDERDFALNADEDGEMLGIPDDDDDDLDDNVPKYLIFSTGSKTYTPHQIGIKRIGNVNFPKKLDPGPSLKDRLAARRAAEKLRELRVDPDWGNYDAVQDRFDKIDKIIDLHGHIIGMALSPDHRYLYVNTRPWPINYIISNALEPPPIAQEIDIHVIDLMTMKRVGNMLRSHKAYTPSNECFFIFLDVCDNYVASGAEDMHAYLWDRYYGVCLAKYKHNDVVNSVAFNPRDSEMLVTTSDDYYIKIWRSRAKAKEYDIDASQNSEAIDMKGNGP